MGLFSRRLSLLDRQVAAIRKITANLVEVTAPPLGEKPRDDSAPLVLRLDGPAARVRHVSFCYATAFFFADVAQGRTEVGARSYRELLEFLMTYPEGSGITRDYAVQAMATEFHSGVAHFMDKWDSYLQLVKQGVRRGPETTSLVVAMLSDIEGNADTEADGERLHPLAEWVEHTLRPIGKGFDDLCRA
jgi:hypothetical protein